MTEKEQPKESKSAEQRLEQTKTERIEKIERIGQLIEKGHLKNSWEKPLPDIDKTAILKPPPATATAKPADTTKPDNTEGK